MRKSLLSIATGALITSFSLFLLALAYPKLFSLFGLLFVTACIILGLSLIAAIPKAPELIYKAIRKRETLKQDYECIIREEKKERGRTVDNA